MKKLVFLFAAIFFSTQAEAQSNRGLLQDTGLPVKDQFLLLRKAEYVASPQAKGTKATNLHIFDTTQWAHLIDSTWGAGLPNADKAILFNQFWVPVDSAYAAFVNLPAYNWDSIVADKLTEINNGVSRGRFAGIIGNLVSCLNDGHTHFYDYTINYGTQIYPGKPVFRAESGLFGACITAIDDSVAMVYEAVNNHPFNLQAGDIILGYNNIPWSQLVQVILRHQLPSAAYIGSTNAATYHRYIQAAGENWYLFDTINIKKCNGSYENYPTSLMIGHGYTNFCTEQMPVQGVQKLTGAQYYNQNISLSSGVVGGKIGYVYMYDCSDGSGDSLLNRVKTLVEDSLVNGLIFDIRTNFGGSFLAFEKTFQYLHNSPVSWLGYGDRNDPHDRYSMFNYGNPAWYDVPDNDPNYFQGPIAVLCGPNAISAGDLFSVLYKHHPMVKTFGLSTAGACGAYFGLTSTYANYYASRQAVNFFQAADPNFYLSHTEFPVDQTEWFTQNSVCNGVDNVVDAAIHWVWETTSIHNQNITVPEITISPNPSTGNARLIVNSPSQENLHLRILDPLGVTIQSFSAIVNGGYDSIDLRLNELQLPSGNYFVIVQGENGFMVTKRITIIN